MAKGKTRLGTILLKARKINNRDLEEAIAKQRVYKRKIGEILVMMGAINPEQLNLYLLVQQAMSEPGLSDTSPDISLLEEMVRERLLSESFNDPGETRGH